MAKKQATEQVEAPEENKQAEDTTLATGITPSADMKAAAVKEEVTPVSELAPKNADSVVEGDKPPRKLKKGEVYLGQGSIMVNN